MTKLTYSNDNDEPKEFQQIGWQARLILNRLRNSQQLKDTECDNAGRGPEQREKDNAKTYGDEINEKLSQRRA